MSASRVKELRAELTAATNAVSLESPEPTTTASVRWIVLRCTTCTDYVPLGC